MMNGGLMSKSIVYVDQCLQAAVSSDDVASLALDFERLMAKAASKQIVIAANGADGPAYVSELRLLHRDSSNVAILADVGSRANNSGGQDALQVLTLPDVTPQNRRSEFEAVFLQHQLDTQQLDAEMTSNLFLLHAEGLLRYQDPRVQMAWQAWHQGAWWMWCYLDGQRTPASLPRMDDTPSTSIDTDLP